ncbi:hypothetical protein QBC32DRAFT_203515 [Pseudoneurospora amorphoporcata]|uniref:Uncharacterized protein n=1 Tax=Pseudoneurospora amorphoporcata TaxID=241081 RepID=A0AAN6SJ24_9PEZI|nr:hypothetical protein QBC32DRAFT_203515 [Pseudoneurospora amorphoporcata]
MSQPHPQSPQNPSIPTKLSHPQPPQNPSTPIYPLFIFLYETEQFLIKALRSYRTGKLEPSAAEKLHSAFKKFNKWGTDNFDSLKALAEDLENSESGMHKPRNYKAYQLLFWRFRGMWPNVYLVQKELAERAKASSQPNQVVSAQIPQKATDIPTLFKKFKSPVMIPFAKWWAELQDKEEGPLLPARSFNQAIDQILSSVEGLIHVWDTDIAPTLVPDKEKVVSREHEKSGSEWEGSE